MSFLIIHSLCVITDYDVLRYVDDNVTMDIMMITSVEIPNKETDKTYHTKTADRGTKVSDIIDVEISCAIYVRDLGQLSQAQLLFILIPICIIQPTALNKSLHHYELQLNNLRTHRSTVVYDQRESCDCMGCLYIK